MSSQIKSVAKSNHHLFDRQKLNTIILSPNDSIVRMTTILSTHFTMISSSSTTFQSSSSSSLSCDRFLFGNKKNAAKTIDNLKEVEEEVLILAVVSLS